MSGIITQFFLYFHFTPLCVLFSFLFSAIFTPNHFKSGPVHNNNGQHGGESREDENFPLVLAWLFQCLNNKKNCVWVWGNNQIQDAGCMASYSVADWNWVLELAWLSNCINNGRVDLVGRYGCTNERSTWEMRRSRIRSVWKRKTPSTRPNIIILTLDSSVWCLDSGWGRAHKKKSHQSKVQFSSHSLSFARISSSSYESMKMGGKRNFSNCWAEKSRIHEKIDQSSANSMVEFVVLKSKHIRRVILCIQSLS